MAKKTVDLDTPFKRGEKVMLVRAIPGHDEGHRGKVKLVNGFDDWKRYWVRFNNGDFVGSVDHADLVRPRMYHLWRERQKNELAVEAAASEASSPVSESNTPATGGVTDQIPAAILERSIAAKKRLTGG